MTLYLVLQFVLDEEVIRVSMPDTVNRIIDRIPYIPYLGVFCLIKKENKIQTLRTEVM